MPYCTQQDLIDRFGENELVQLTDRSDPPAGIIDSTVVDKAIADAGALIDSYLQARYSLPLVQVPATLERVACDLTRYYLHEDAVPEIVKANYDHSVSFLRQVSRGEAAVGPTSGGDRPATSNVAQMETGGRVFGRGSSGFL